MSRYIESRLVKSDLGLGLDIFIRENVSLKLINNGYI